MSRPTTPQNQSELPLRRSAAYGLLAQAWRFPAEQWHSRLADGTWLRGLTEAAKRAAPPVRKTVRSLRAAIGQRRQAAPDSVPSLETLQAEYVRLFAHSRSFACPPYETEYTTPHMYAKVQSLADLRGFYRAFGVDVGEEHPERPDHLAAELEFMHYLALKEAHAEEQGNPEAQRICASAQARFLEAHLAAWPERFAQRLAQANASMLYVALGRLTAAFIAQEATTMGVTPKALPFRASLASSPLFACDGGECPLAGPSAGCGTTP